MIQYSAIGGFSPVAEFTDVYETLLIFTEKRCINYENI